MPVYATPVFTAPPSLSPTFSPLITVAPATTRVYGVPVPGKMRGANARQAQRAQIQVQLLDDTGNPVDLTAYGFPSSGTDTSHVISVLAREATLLGCGEAGQVDGTVITASSGVVRFPTPNNVLSVPGVYLCEVGAFTCVPDTTGDCGMILSNTVYLMIERGLWSITGLTESTNLGPPTIQEIRLALRDSPEGNRLTDEYEFDVAEICDAVVRSVHYWNSAPPLINAFCTTTTFPYRYQWLDGITADLFERAASYYRRTHLPYQSGGIAVDDLNKSKEYLEAAEMRRQRWEYFVKMRKSQLNAESCYGTLGSTYWS